MGMEGREVFVETDITRGLPGIGMSGLASTMVMESRERIKNAIINEGYVTEDNVTLCAKIPAVLIYLLQREYLRAKDA